MVRSTRERRLVLLGALCTLVACGGPPRDPSAERLARLTARERIALLVAPRSGVAAATGVAVLGELPAGGVEAGGVPVLGWDRAWLEAVELDRLRAAIAAGADAVLLGAVALPSITGDSLALPLSPTAVRGLVRRDLGWDGVVMADVGQGGVLECAYGAPEAAVRAVAAGVDVLRGAGDGAAVVGALLAAVADGRIPRSRVDAAALRVLRQRGARAEESRVNGSVRPPDAAVPAAGSAAPVLRAVGAEAVGMSEQGLTAVDRAIREAIGDSVFTGAALAVGRRGGLVRLRGYGTLDGREGSPPVSAEETLFDLASLSKVVGTTTAVALLTEGGAMELDAPVGRYLRGFRGEGKGEVRVWHLLTHTSGLPAGRWLYGSADSPEEALRQALEQPLLGPPGAKVRYSDLGMIVLARAAERAAGEPLDLFLARHLFAPLGMSRTMYLPPVYFLPTTVPTARTSERPFELRAVVHDGNAYRLGGVAGHAGLFSTARDVAVFAQWMLQGGAYGPARLLTPATVRAFTTRQPGADERGLGWDTPAAVSSAGRYLSARSYGHTGYTGTSLWIDPDRELFVVLLTNRTYTEGSAREILRVRQAVHEAVARAITDGPVARRRGAR